MDAFQSMLASAHLSATRLLVETAGATLLTTLVYLVHRHRRQFLASLRARFDASTRHAIPYVVASMLLPLLVRLALVPWLPPPAPAVHDEFGHLLVADTLLAGRLANPPHPVAQHLEAIYVLQQPTYASSYPIGQGIALAAGQGIMGHPWAGVLLATMLMCGGVTWMLFGCLPPRWAAAGGMLAAVHFGLATPWIDSYWGGAFCAFGGALLFGAICRFRGLPSMSLALVAGVGWGIVWLVRPFESILLFASLWIYLAVIVLRHRGGRYRWFAPLAVLVVTHALAAAVTLAHNRAVTGSFTTLPYQLSQRAYGVPQSFSWQAAVPPPPFHFPEAERMYWWQRERKDRADARPAERFATVLFETWVFYLTPWYTVPLFLLPLLFRERAVMTGAALLMGALVVAALYPFFFPHYIAAYSALIFFLIVRGLMRLSRWSIAGRRVGLLAATFLAAGGLATGMRIVPVREMLRNTTAEPPIRAEVASRLRSLGGRHLVLVRYGSGHSFQDEWVYNAASIDDAPIVWCRSVGAQEDERAMQYFRGRRIWLADVERHVARIESLDSAGAGASTGEASDAWVITRRPIRDSTYPRR